MPAGPPRPDTPAVPWSELVRLIEGSVQVGFDAADSPCLLTGVTHDSRQVRPGDLYCALSGERVHGADFLEQAVSAGAVGLLTDPAGQESCRASGLPTIVVPDVRAVMGDVAALIYGQPASALTMFGITGTNGKTTTAYLLAAILREAGRTVGLIGTIETRIVDQVLPSVRTTPESTDLHAVLAVMRERGADAVVMEVSSHAVSMGRINGVVFDVVGFTNLSQDHLDFHGDMEQYFAAKSALFTASHARAAVVCVDDPWGVRLADHASIDVTRVRAVDAPPIGMAGSFNQQNAAVAAAMAELSGVGQAEIKRALSAAPTIPGRMETVVPAGSAARMACIVDYAHTPDAIARVLEGLRGDDARAVLVVIVGAGGDRDAGKREAMGAAAAARADVVIVTDDNPRSEDPAQIRAQVLQGARQAGSSAEVEDIPDRRAAIEAGVDIAWDRGATLVILGKGHEQGQEVAGVISPFDDRVVAREAISRKQSTA